MMGAQELTHELIAWQEGKHPVSVVAAFLVAAAKIAAAEGMDGESMHELLRVAFAEERGKYTQKNGNLLQ